MFKRRASVVTQSRWELPSQSLPMQCQPVASPEQSLTTRGPVEKGEKYSSQKLRTNQHPETPEHKVSIENRETHFSQVFTCSCLSLTCTDKKDFVHFGLLQPLPSVGSNPNGLSNANSSRSWREKELQCHNSQSGLHFCALFAFFCGHILCI